MLRRTPACTVVRLHDDDDVQKVQAGWWLGRVVVVENSQERSFAKSPCTQKETERVSPYATHMGRAAAWDQPYSRPICFSTVRIA
jgi:hypothetical protein